MACPPEEASRIAQHLSALSVNDGGDELESGTALKDPRKIARKYQLDLCKIALEENTIVYLETGCGKTHIAVLLMYEMRHLIKKPQRKICVFLAPTVALVQQQAEVIRDSTDFQVGTYCGSSKLLRSHKDWEKEGEQSEVFVMTPQIFLHNLCHCFMKIESIALLIFDECHYAQLESGHPYAEIMKVFYNSNIEELPRIFGMTASPKLGKGGSISTLETLLHAKVHSVDDREELEKFVSSPGVRIYYYGPSVDSSSCSLTDYCRKLDEIKLQCVSELSKEHKDHGALQSIRKMILKLHNNLIFCLKQLGVRGAQQACGILSKGDPAERDTLIGAERNGGDDPSTKRYLAQAASIFGCDSAKGSDEAGLPCEEVLQMPNFSLKLLRLIEILLEFRVRPNMKCIVFVSRILVATSLSGILQSLKFLSTWKSHHLLGVHSGLKGTSRKNMNSILEKFRSGELNLLVATKVAEEGLDIQTCCLVIRFDLPETVASFIQSRGRARMPQSEYAFLVDRGNESELNLIENFKKEEEKMNKEVTSTRPGITFVDFDEKTYKVSSTGATISCGASVQLVHRYCSKLPHDEYFIPKPEYSYFDDENGTVCKLLLPSNAPIRRITSSPQPSGEAAKKDACLEACKKLHELGTLSDYLLPDQEDEKSLEDFSDSDSSDDEDSRRELHEMLVPSALKEPWTDSEHNICFYSYFFKFTPTPADRVYQKFGLFIKASLPSEAEKMKLNLSLACGRSVAVELIPSGVAKLDKDEVRQALNVQEIFLKVILDRSDFIPETFSLGKNGFGDGGSPTFYLLLPVILHEPEPTLNVDWKLVRRCLSSPIFSTQEEEKCHTAPQLDSLNLANGSHSILDIRNSLVYAPCKDTFFFISDVVSDKNGYSIYKDKGSKNHVEHYIKKFRIYLSYPKSASPKAKQLFCLNNLLKRRKSRYHCEPPLNSNDSFKPESREKEEHFVELPPEICQLKIIGFSKEIGSSLSLLPSVMHRLQSLLVAIELKDRFSASFPEGSEITAYQVLEALTTERCGEGFSLERLEVLGDAFLKFVVGRHVFLLHNNSDEGQLTNRRSNFVNNSNLLKLAISKSLQVYIRDQPFEPSQYFALGRPCTVVCSKEAETGLHSFQENSTADGSSGVRCNKNHHWLQKKTIADVVEALVGAFIVDSGFKAATAFLKWIGIPLDFQPLQVSEICNSSEVFKPLASEIDLSAIEKALGYQFVHKGLLVQAFIHPSYNNHCGGCYQRLEFLGDAVLDYLITSYLYSVYPKLKPGQFTDLRSMCVSNTSFANIAVLRSFHNYILCNSKELRTSMNKYVNFIRTTIPGNGPVEGPSCPKALGDLIESSVGAILLDTGFDLNRVWKIMLSFMDPVKNISNFRLHPGRELQELCQFHNMKLQFPTLKKDRVYSVEAIVEGGTVREKACATNINKKAARKMASERLFHKLKDLGYKSKAKSLEEVLKSSHKMEAKLMGYDETPIDITAPVAVLFDSLNIQEPSGSRYNGELNRNGEEIFIEDRPISPLNQPPESQRLQSNIVIEDHRPDSVAPVTGVSSKKTARSCLYELCAVNYWKPPVFECCDERGESHLKEFTFKVLVDIDEASGTIDATGTPHAKKKEAAESAAVAALWYLKCAGYLQ